MWAGDSYSSYGFLIVAWSAWLAWTARGLVRAAPWRVEPIGLAALAAGIAMLALAKAGASLPLAVLSLPVVLIGLGRYALGREAFRTLLFPTAFLAFMTPLPAEAIPAISLPLQQLATAFTAIVLTLVGIPFVRDGLFFRLDAVIVHIAEGCSGLRFLLVMIVLGIASAWAIERRLAVRLFVCGLAVTAAIAANLVRVASTVILVELHGPAAAAGTFHSLFGKALYLVALGLFFLAARRLRARPAAVEPDPIPGVDVFAGPGDFAAGDRRGARP